MKKSMYYRTREYEKLTFAFIEKVLKQYHYNMEDYSTLELVAKDLRSCLKEQEEMEIVFSEEDETSYVDIAISMGNAVDLLLNKYSKNQRVLEQLMVENIMSELLMEAYNSIETLLNKQGFQVEAYHFWGAEDGFPLEKIKDIMVKFSNMQLSYTKDFSLRPSKSVLFRADLSRKRISEKGKEAGKNQNATDDCTLICKSCNRHKDGSCLYRQ